MIVDAETLDLVNAIESAARGPRRRRHQARAHGVGARDLDRAVRDTAETGEQLRALRAPGHATARARTA